jgi:hypothetical protein
MRKDTLLSQYGNTVCKRCERIQIMRHQQHGQTQFLAQLACQPDKAFGSIRVKTGGRLIEKQQLRLQRQRTSQCHTLHHAARQLRRQLGGGILRQADEPELETGQLVHEARIEVERRKFGSSGSLEGDPGYATTVAEFERLTVDREFAEQGYLRALSAYDAARAQANRQSRYLAAYIQPTLAEAAEFPQRMVIIGVTGLFAFLIWSILSLVFYALRDRN